MSQPAREGAAFIPFDPLAASPARPVEGDFHLKVVPGSPAGQGQPGSHKHPMAAPQPAAGSPVMADTQPVVTLQRDGDKVTGIRILCVCGQVIELACSY